MAKYTSFIISMCLGGCTMSPVYQYEKPGLERSLPSDVAMTDYVDHDWMGYRVTVEDGLQSSASRSTARAEKTLYRDRNQARSG